MVLFWDVPIIQLINWYGYPNSLRKKILFWIMTTQQAKFMAKQIGTDHVIEKTGIKLLDSTFCFHFSSRKFWQSGGIYDGFFEGQLSHSVHD